MPRSRAKAKERAMWREGMRDDGKRRGAGEVEIGLIVDC